MRRQDGEGTQLQLSLPRPGWTRLSPAATSSSDCSSVEDWPGAHGP